MPIEQQPISVLVSGKAGGTTQALSESEYDTLTACLNLSRSEDRQLRAITDAILRCTRDPRAHNFPEHMQEMLSYLTECADDVRGLLIDRWRPPVMLDNENNYTGQGSGLKEPDILYDLVTVLRGGGWFAEWISALIRRFADRAKNPPPTPLQIMGLLTLEAAEFDEKLQAAKHVLQNHWESLGFAGLTPPDPAAYKAPEIPAAQPKPPKDIRMFQLTEVDEGDVKEPANLTRREFQELKKHLASMRAAKAKRGKKAA